MDYLKNLIEEYLDEMDKFIAYQEWLVKSPSSSRYNYKGELPSKERLERLGVELRKKSVEVEKVLKHGAL